jgi:hypothetical protein
LPTGTGEVAVAVQVPGSDRPRVAARSEVEAEAAVPVSGEHVHLVRRRDCQVETAVAVQVGDRDRRWRVAGGDGRAGGFREAAAPVSEQHGRPVQAGVGDSKVGMAVAVQVADRDRLGAGTGREGGAGGCAEAAAAVSEQHGHVVCPEVRDCEVGPAVAVQVADRDRGRAVAGGEGGACRFGEATAAVPEQDGDRIRVLVGDGEVRVSVAGQVADGDGSRVAAGGERRSRCCGEPAAAVAEQHGHHVVGDCGGNDVGRPVAVTSATATAAVPSPLRRADPGAGANPAAARGTNTSTTAAAAANATATRRSRAIPARSRSSACAPTCPV